MILRPADANGDMLPVLFTSDVLSGVFAEAELTRDRLNLMTGDWWENPSWGNGIVELLKESRWTEADQQVLATYLSSYIRKTPGVQDIRDVQCAVEGRRFLFSCTIETEYGSADIQYEI